MVKLVIKTTIFVAATTLVALTPLTSGATGWSELELVDYTGPSKHYQFFLTRHHGYVKVSCRHHWWRGKEVWIETGGITQTPGGRFLRYNSTVEECEPVVENWVAWFLDTDFPFEKAIKVTKDPDGGLLSEQKIQTQEQAYEVFRSRQQQLFELNQDGNPPSRN